MTEKNKEEVDRPGVAELAVRGKSPAGAQAVERTDLSIKMHALADRGHGRAGELREKADAFDAATLAHYGASGNADTAKRLLGCWARARRAWSECSGESL
jgi:hypothetical protein